MAFDQEEAYQLKQSTHKKNVKYGKAETGEKGLRGWGKGTPI